MEIPELLPIGIGNNKISPPSDEDSTNKWKGSSNLSNNLIISNQKNVILGPGQVQPKGYRLTSGRYGELKLGFIMTKGMLEVEVYIN